MTILTHTTSMGSLSELPFFGFIPSPCVSVYGFYAFIVCLYNLYAFNADVRTFYIGASQTQTPKSPTLYSEPRVCAYIYPS